MRYLCTEYEPHLNLKAGKIYFLNSNVARIKLLVKQGVLVDPSTVDVHQVRVNALPKTLQPKKKPTTPKRKRALNGGK